MTRKNINERSSKPMTDAQREERDSPERAAAPPIEREHETYAGVFEENEHREEDERREQQDERSEHDRR